MRKPLYVLMSVLILAACGDAGVNSKPIDNDERTEANKDELTSEELDELFRTEATEVDFVKINADEVDEGSKVYAEGEVIAVDPTGEAIQWFILKTDEPDDDHGVYEIQNLLVNDIEVGEQVKIYGVYSGKDEDGTPEIQARIVERIE